MLSNEKWQNLYCFQGGRRYIHLYTASFFNVDIIRSFFSLFIFKNKLYSYLFRAIKEIVKNHGIAKWFVFSFPWHLLHLVLHRFRSREKRVLPCFRFFFFIIYTEGLWERPKKSAQSEETWITTALTSLIWNLVVLWIQLIGLISVIETAFLRMRISACVSLCVCVVFVFLCGQKWENFLVAATFGLDGE